MKYGHPELLDRESLFRFFFWMKHTPPAESGAFMSHTECSEVAWRLANTLTMLLKRFDGPTG